MLIIVIHLIEEIGCSIQQRTVEQCRIALSNGADGVFLIPGQGGLKVHHILDCYKATRESYPDRFIGINFLTSPELCVENLPIDANALWVDFGLGSTDQSNKLQFIREGLSKRKWKGILFGGFMFKGNNSVSPSHEIMQNYVAKLKECMDVAVTSGPCTGVSADISYMLILRQYAKSAGVPLGLASGINIHNIHSYLSTCDYFIVGTGVERDCTDPSTIQFYQEAGIPNGAVDVGYLNANKIRMLQSIIEMK